MQRLIIVGLFAFQIVVGGLLFVVVGIVALALKLFLDFLKTNGAPDLVSDALHLIEIFLFGLDALCFIMFISVESLLFCHKMWDEIKH